MTGCLGKRLMGFTGFRFNRLDFIVAVWLLHNIKPTHPTLVMIHGRAVQYRSVEPDHNGAAIRAVHHVWQ
jgi:hypothetical protein